MANWFTKRVSDLISDISEGNYVLPVIQRRLVWQEEKMEVLFDTLLKNNSFGGIMTLIEDANTKPLFAFRRFSIDGNNVSSSQLETVTKRHYLVIDGQQRLQSFYLGLKGSYFAKLLYFDLYSDYKSLEYEFKWANEEENLPKQNNDRVVKTVCWYAAKNLYERLAETRDEEQVAEELINIKMISNESEKEHIKKNVKAFYKSIFDIENIGISSVVLNRSMDENENKQRIVELFKRLNDGGTKLSSFDLIASVLKGFEWKMEKFLDDILQGYSEIGLSQDNLIKILFLLRDDYSKEVSAISEEDAKFAVENKDRIQKSLIGLKNFLVSSNLYNYYKEQNRSFIPLFFIIYHIFHSKKIPTETLSDIFKSYDTTDKNFKNIYEWLYLSLINGVFRSRGAGWIPYKTGIKKILEVAKDHKNSVFPKEALFQIYADHPVDFSRRIWQNNLDSLDFNFTFYLIYDRQQTVREQDKDHIHSQFLLYRRGIQPHKINQIANFQLLDSFTNRGSKSAKNLKDWIEGHVENQNLYLTKHLIPSDRELWDEKNFDAFVSERSKMIIERLNKVIFIS